MQTQAKMSTKSKHVEALFNTEVDQVFASTTIFLCFHLKKSLYRRSRSHQLDWSLRLTDESTTISIFIPWIGDFYRGYFSDLKLNSILAFLTIIFLEFLRRPYAIDFKIWPSNWSYILFFSLLPHFEISWVTL